MTAAFSEPRLRRLTDGMRGYVERKNLPGLVALIARRGAVHVTTIGKADLESGKPLARDSIFRIASMTKPVAAVAAMMLVEETKLRLDDPVDRFLPELAGRKVLRSLESPLDDTVPASRAVTLRDLLTFRAGIGLVMAPPGRYPFQQAVADAALAPGPMPFPHGPDEYMARIGRLPLLHQPGERWLYHTGSDILGVLVARAAGMRFEDFLAERIFAPLGMVDTGFHVPEAKLDRLVSGYQLEIDGRFTLQDPGRGGRWAKPPAFASGGGGLVSTADDYLAFARMLLGLGRGGGTRLLARPTVELMLQDHIMPAEKAVSPFFPGFWDSSGWGFGLSVATARAGIGPSVGSYGWVGGFGTVWQNDPHEDLSLVLLTQRMMRGPDDMQFGRDFFTLAYQALDD